MRVGIDRRLIYHFDWAVFLLTFAIALVGLLSVASASHGVHRPFQTLMIRQIIWTVAGAAPVFAVGGFGYPALARYSYPLFIAPRWLVVVVGVRGPAARGARRRVTFCPVSLRTPL